MAFSFELAQHHHLPDEWINVIQELHSSFAFHLSENMSEFFHEPVSIQLMSIEQELFSNYLLSLIHPTCLSVIDMSLCTKPIILEVNSAIAYAVINKMLGGDAKLPSVVQVMTNLEAAMLRKFLNLLLKQLSLEWASIEKTSFAIQELIPNASIHGIIANHHYSLISRFKVSFGSVQGLISLAIPCDNLFTISEQIERLIPEHARNKIKTPVSWENINVQLTARLGQTQLSQEEIKSLKPGDILPLNTVTYAPIDVLFEGDLLWRGIPGLVGKYKGIKLKI